MAELRENIGKNIRRKRLEKGWTGGELATRAGITATHVYNLEKGHNKFSIDVLESIAKALNCDTGELL